MAQVVEFKECNDVIGKPKEATDNQYYSLPVSRIITFIPGKTPADPAEEIFAMVSCWQLSFEELQEINKTGKVYLKVIGATTPGVSVHGIKPIYPGTGKLSDTILNKDQIRVLHGGKPLKDIVNEMVDVANKIQGPGNEHFSDSDKIK